MPVPRNSGDPTETLLERLPLKRILEIVAMSSIFSFFISEMLFLYFLNGGISRFPENIVVCMFVLTVGLGLIRRFLSGTTAILTFYTSSLTLIFILNWFFGSSTDPSIIANFIHLERDKDTRMLFDFLIIGLAGNTLWLIFSLSLYDFIGKVREMSIRNVFLSFRANITRIIKFFDLHPWLATILIGIITLLVGIVIGTWQR